MWVAAIVGTYMVCRWSHIPDDVRIAQSSVAPLTSYIMSVTYDKCITRPRPKGLSAYKEPKPE